jgi:hypothetical protein
VALDWKLDLLFSKDLVAKGAVKVFCEVAA